MLKRNIGFILVFVLLFSTFTTSVFAQGDTEQASTLIELKVSNNLLSMTEAREVDIEVDLGYRADLSQLTWTFGGKDFTEWKKWNNDTKDYSGEPWISFAAAPTYVEGTNTIKAKIKFDLIYGTENLATPRILRTESFALIGLYDLAVADLSTNTSAKATLKLTIYDSFTKYEEIKPTVDQIFAEAQANNSRYLEYQSIGKTVEGRDMHFVVLAKDQASVDQYLNETLPTALENPAVLIEKINNGTIGDYKLPIWFNNLHADEIGPDAMLELLDDFATEDTISYKTTDADGNEKDVTINVDEALDNVIFLFNLANNGDGRARHVRTNANGFDLNRDNGMQTQPEAIYTTQQIAKWTPVSFLDFHGYVKDFLIEPTTPPHNPNYEYDLLMEGMIEQANEMGRAGVANTKYEKYIIPMFDYESGWDDMTPAYTATYAMFQGSMGHTVETPELNQAGVDAMYYTGLASTKYVMDNKNDLFKNQLEVFNRGVNGEDNVGVDQWLVNQKGEVIGRDRGENASFFPEYYVLPVDSAMQKNALEAYKMVEYLLRNGIKVEETTEAVTIGEKTYPAGTYIVPMRQAKRGYANAVLDDGEDVSDWDKMYDPVVLNFPDLRGFIRDTVWVESAFAGKTVDVEKVDIPNTKVENNGDQYVIRNTNNDAIKAVNQLLAEGKSVKMILETAANYEMGDFLVSKKDLDSVKEDYLLDVLVFDGKADAKLIVRPKVFAPGSSQGNFVLKQLGFNVVASAKDSNIIVDDAGKANKEDILAGKNYIGIGGSALKFIKESGVYAGFDYASTDLSHEGLLLTSVAQDSPISAEYDSEEYLYSASGSWITAVPENAQVLATVSNEDNYYKAGWWPGHEAVKGQTLAITDEIGEGKLTLFANDLVFRAVPQYSYRLLANAIFTSFLPEATFNDLMKHWAKDPIDVLAAMDIVEGLSADSFAPDQKITRAQFAALIARALQLEVKPVEGVFTDVSTNQWFAQSVEAAAKAGIVQGLGQNIFMPDEEITREEMAVMTARAMKYEGKELTAGSLTFADKNQISSWAEQAVSTAVGKEILTGISNTTFAPQSDATRGQAAVVIYRFLKVVGKL